MSGCTITPITVNKACSGKCMGAACNGAPRIWVVAACEGMISLFGKSPKGALAPIQRGNHGVFSSLDAFQKTMDDAESMHEFDQLVIIGSGNDIAWIHASLPTPVTHHIIAEIEYPLLSSWFKQPVPLSNLTRALEGVFIA